MIFFGNGGSGIFFIIMFILVLTFAVTLLPYILIFGFIWFVVKSLLRPFTSRSSSYQGRPEGEGEAYRKSYEARPTETSGDPVIDNQVKSVQDEDFFRQNHEVVDVNYDEEEDHTTT